MEKGENSPTAGGEMWLVFHNKKGVRFSLAKQSINAEDY